MQLPKITVHPLKIAELIAPMSNGSLQVPRFQREFVWPIAKTRALLDSMFKEFPIGTFFLWKAPLGTAPLARPLDELGIPQPPPGLPIQYILDGQQRLTSLYAVINGKKIRSRDYENVCIDLQTAAAYLEDTVGGFDKSIFVHRIPDNNRYVSVRAIVGENHLAIYDKIPHQWRPAFSKALNIFQTYPFSVVEIQEQKLEDATIIFQRINQGGKRLTRFDLVCANIWTEDFDFRKEASELNKSLKAKGFGELDGTIFTQTSALILKDQCTTETELALKASEVKPIWDKVTRAIELAIDFASNNLGVVRSDFLPYRGMLVVLAYYFYHAKNSAISAKEREGLWQWFWQVALSERYSSTSPLKMADDAKKLKNLMQGQFVQFGFRYTITPEALIRTTMTSSSSALRNAVLCLFALKHPKSLKDGSPINLKADIFADLKKAERHHVFPIAFLKKDKRYKQKSAKIVHALPNFCFLPSDLNKEISNKAPADYMEEYKASNPDFASAADSHLIPVHTDSAIWKNDLEKFLRQRAELIVATLTKIAESTPSDLTAPVVLPYEVDVDETEIEIRDFIDHRLNAIVGSGYWVQSVPKQVRDKADATFNMKKAIEPYLNSPQSGREYLDYCDVAHYGEIITANWDQFAEYFGQQSEFAKHIGAFRLLRNDEQHNRVPTDVEILNGRAAMRWLGQIIDKYFDDQAEEEEIEDEEEDEQAQ